MIDHPLLKLETYPYATGTRPAVGLKPANAPGISRRDRVTGPGRAACLSETKCTESRRAPSLFTINAADALARYPSTPSVLSRLTSQCSRVNRSVLIFHLPSSLTYSSS